MIRFLIGILFVCTIRAEENDIQFYKKVFPDFTQVTPFDVEDTISKDPINNKILKVFKQEELIGFIREIHTTTGCDSACLPVSYTSFYNAKGDYLKILSRHGLTKINHASFTSEDYSQLEFIVTLGPKEFDSIKHPKELTDAISGATLKPYKQIVVKGAAYSTLRIHLYNVNTQKLIKEHLKKPNFLLK